MKRPLKAFMSDSQSSVGEGITSGILNVPISSLSQLQLLLSVSNTFTFSYFSLSPFMKEKGKKENKEKAL